MTQDNCTLLPCPFCGGAAEMDTQRSYMTLGASPRLDSAVAIYCVDCGADHSICRADHRGIDTDILVAEVTAAWNKRATPPADMEGAVEAAANAVKLEWTVMCQEMGRDFPISSISPTNFRLLRAALTAALPALQRTAPDGYALIKDAPIFLQGDGGWYAINITKPRFCFFGKTLEEAQGLAERATAFVADERSA